jgi:prolyl 4-hydroxylase
MINSHEVYTVDILTAEECEKLIKFGEKEGFKAVDYDQNYRSNTRAMFDRAELADWLWRRLLTNSTFVDNFSSPSGKFCRIVDECGEPYQICGINPRFRCCRYEMGQKFAGHYDSSSFDGYNRSFYTVMIYLNDSDACTQFYENIGDMVPALRVKPVAGRAVIFLQNTIFHDSEQLTGEGQKKYILRTDLMYSTS